MKFYCSKLQSHAEDYLCNDLEDISFETKKRLKELTLQKEKQSNLYVRVFLSNSPCNNCAGKLSRFRQNLMKDLTDVNPVLEIQVKSLFNVSANKLALQMLLKNNNCFLLRCLNWSDFYSAFSKIDYINHQLQKDDKKKCRSENDPNTNRDIIAYCMNATMEWAVNFVEEKTECTRRELNALNLQADLLH